MLNEFARPVGVKSLMQRTLQNAKDIAIGDLCNLREDTTFAPPQNANMAKGKKEPNNLRAWREFRHMTQDELAEKAETTGSVISLLESGERGLSSKWLRKLAPALGTTPGFLLDHDPRNLDTAFIEAAMAVPQANRQQALDILKTFSRTGTDG